MPVSDESLQRRKFLSGTLKLLLLIGFIFLSIPFISSVSTRSSGDRPGQKDDWVISLSLADLVAGKLKSIPWAGGAIWVYHRTEKDIAALKHHGMLRDPLSDKSDQPADMKNDWRSADVKYFVFIPQENKRGCQVRLEQYRGPAGEQALFVEPCYGARYDAAGRVLQNSGQADQLNLPVPQHRIEAGTLNVAAWTPGSRL